MGNKAAIDCGPCGDGLELLFVVPGQQSSLGARAGLPGSFPTPGSPLPAPEDQPGILAMANGNALLGPLSLSQTPGGLWVWEEIP